MKSKVGSSKQPAAGPGCLLFYMHACTHAGYIVGSHLAEAILFIAATASATNYLYKRGIETLKYASFFTI